MQTLSYLVDDAVFIIVVPFIYGSDFVSYNFSYHQHCQSQYLQVKIGALICFLVLSSTSSTMNRLITDISQFIEISYLFHLVIDFLNLLSNQVYFIKQKVCYNEIH